MHAITHSLAHRGPTAGRSRPRWQPYSSIPSSSRSPSSSYLNTPASTVPTPATSQLPSYDSERTKPLAPLSSLRDGPLREAQKLRYVNGLVDLAVKSLCEIWHPHDIPTVFTTPGRPSTATVIAPTPATITFHYRNTQLPSPVSPSQPYDSPAPKLNNSSASSHDRETPRPQASTCRADAIPLKSFVHEVLRRSRTSCSVLQTALCYLEAVRPKVPEILRQERLGNGAQGEADQGFRIIREEDLPPHERIYQDDDDEFAVPCEPPMHLPDNPLATPCGLWQRDPQSSAKPWEPSGPLPPLPPLPSPLLCPRRTFLAALILASKFLQDKCYSNRAWAKLAGLPAREIGRCERALGDALDWRLWVGKLPPRRPPLARSWSESRLPGTCAPANAFFPQEGGFNSATAAPAGAAGGLRRCTTVPDGLFATPAPLQDTPMLMPPPPPPLVPMPMASARRTVLATDSLADFAPATAMLPPMPTMPIWSSADAQAGRPPSPTSTYCSSSPTPTLTASPSSTVSSADGFCEERTVQMSSFAEMPSPGLDAMKTDGEADADADRTFARAGELPSDAGSYMSEGGIALAWDGVWAANGASVMGAQISY
ncbi:hypothetical protein DENSPDRAFT_489981 [Dentipellis sp. KUC8613]|nr:hypothetical protein DENSPDRAFT_489981 [Dentipellis sp. KUC8613]